MISDRELLEALYAFLLKQNYVLGDTTGIKDMVLRYQQPPLTMLHRVAMRMSVNDYNTLAQLMKDIEAHLKPAEETAHDAV